MIHITMASLHLTLNMLTVPYRKASVPFGGPLIGVLTAATAGLMWSPLAAAMYVGYHRRSTRPRTIPPAHQIILLMTQQLVKTPICSLAKSPNRQLSLQVA